ncbi:MAG: Gx transporter family protein [Provencibacterium sp.]|jgi:heptaprenyl diphosphate synthase|nr:Gx transporter family protein [Provencibacterium sp.]
MVGKGSIHIRVVTVTGLLFSLAMVLSFFESFLVGMLALPPGIKLGLSNVVVLFAMLALGKRSAWLLIVLKAMFAVLTRGAVAGLLSLSGGICSVFLMGLLAASPRLAVGYRLLCAAGACAHNLGQILAAALVIQNRYLLYYLPLLLLAGILTGVLTGTVYWVVEPYLRRWKAGAL